MTSPNAGGFRSGAFLALLAIVGMVWYLVSVVAAHLLRPGIDPVSRPVSDYAVGPFGLFVGIAIFALGVGSLALALGLRLGIAPPGRSRAGLLLLALYGVGQLAVAVFPIDAEGAQTATGLVHNIAGNVSFFCFPPPAILLSVGMGKDERWRALKRPALALALIVLVEAILVVSANVVVGFGIAQRFFLLTTVLWMLLAAIRLRYATRKPTPGDAAWVGARGWGERPSWANRAIHPTSWKVGILGSSPVPGAGHAAREEGQDKLPGPRRRVLGRARLRSWP